MAYLQNEDQHRQHQQNLQQTYHQQYQQEQKRLHHESHLIFSPYPNNHHQHQHNNQQDREQKQSSAAQSADKIYSNQQSKVKHMIDEYNEDSNVKYKLSISPTNVKHENQDDGYETSAGDVLTPNSYTSSTHTTNPQHQIQNELGIIVPPSKCDDQETKRHQMQLTSTERSITQGMISENADGYSFIDHDDVPNVRMLSSSNEPLQNPSQSRFQRILNSSATFLKDEDIAAVSMQQKHHHQQLVASVEINNGEQHQQQQLENHQHHQQQQDQQQLGSSVILNVNNKGTQNYICVDSSEEQISTKGVIVINEDSSMKPPQKRRGRKKKNLLPGNILADMPTAIKGGVNIGCFKRKERKKHDRFNGMSEEEVAKRLLPDHLCNNLDIVIVGINPGLFAAFKGHHYAGPGNHFWKCLYLAGLTRDQMSAEEDFTLMKYGIGFTNMVQRATKGSADLTRKEIKEGSRILLEKLQRFRPKIAVFNGKLIYEVFSGKKDFHFGRQPEFVDGTDTYIWVMPSSSARCAQLPRAADKVPFYLALKKFRDYLNGLIPHMDETECVFTELKIKQFCEQSNLKFLITGDGVNLSSVNKSDSISNNSDDKIAKTESDLMQLNNNICDHNKSNENIYLTKSLERNAIQQHYKSVHRFYLYGSQENVSSTGMSSHPRGSGQHNLMGMNENGFMISNCQTVSLLPKKKRGRPKKIKETMDPSTASKILVRGSGHNFNNILNLSMIPDSRTEVAKKKRGRPKKLKSTAVTQSPQQHRQQQLLLEKCNIMSIQAIAEEHSLPLQQERMPCSQAPRNIQQQQGSYANSPSPIRSPDRKGIFLSGTSPESQPNAPRKDELKIEFLDQSIRMRTADKSNFYTGKISQPAISSSISSPPQTRLQNKHMTTEASELIANEIFLKKSTVPISQNVCAVGFDPLCLSRSSEPRKIEADFSQRQSSSHEKQHQQRSRYGSPISDTVDEQLETNENLHQWMSPNIHQQQHLPIGLHSSFNFSHQRQPTMVMHYQDQQMNHREEPQLNWQHHRQFQVNFDESTHNYILDIQHQQQQIDQLSQQQSQQLTTDVSRNSLSGLESLVDKIPTMSESETSITNSLSVSATSAVENRLHTSVSAALENSLQTMETAPSDNQHNSDSLVSEGNAEMYIELGTSCTLNITNNDNNDNIICENGGSNAPPITNSNYPSGSPGNYSVHRHHSLSTASSPVSHASMQSPHYQLHTTAQLISQYNDHRIYASSPSEYRMDHMPPSIPNGILNSPPNVGNISIPLLGSSFSGSVLNKNCNNTANNIHTNNFSVSHLAASSATPSASGANVNDSYPPPTTSNATYHHSNILTAAALTSSTVNTLPICDEPTPVAITTLSNHISSHPHLHLDPHAHLSVPVKTNVHGNSHVHPHLLTHVFGPSAQGQHSPLSDFDATPYGSPSTAVAAIQAGNQDSPAHTLHMPSPNYPYGYATPPTQSSYANAMHVHSQSTPLPSGAVSAVAAAAAAAAVAEYQNAHHQHHHGPPSGHHISVFERLKASDIGGYSSF